jgi:hypothetical protein
MVVARREGDERIARLLRGYPHRAVTVPFAGKNILGKPGKEVSRQRRLFEGEGVEGAWNDNKRAVGNLQA